MRGPQQMIDVDEGGLGERAQRLARHDQHVVAHDFFDAHAVGGELAVGRVVRAEREQRACACRGDGGRGDGGVHGTRLFASQALETF